MVGRARISTGLRVAVADADEQVGRCLVVEEPACGVVFLRASEYRHRISLVQRIAVVDTDREGREVVAQRAARDADRFRRDVAAVDQRPIERAVGSAVPAGADAVGERRTVGRVVVAARDIDRAVAV